MTTFSVKGVVSLTDRVSAPLEGINRRMRDLNKPFRRLRAARINLSRSLGLDQATRSVGRLLSGLRGLAGPLGVISAGGAVAGLSRILTTYSQDADQFAKTARLIGISGEELQKYTFVAERSGVAQGTLTSSLTAFTKRLGEARAGSGSLHSILKKTNPTLLDQVVAAESTGEAFRLLMGEVASLESETDKAALASAAFSRAGLAMVAMASGGAEEIARLFAEFERLGGTIGEDNLNAAEAYRDAVSNLNVSLGGLRNVIGSRLLQIMDPFVQKMTEQIATMVTSGEVSRRLDGTMEGLSRRLESFDLGSFLDGLAGFAGSVESIVQSIGGWENALIGLGVVMAGPVLAAITSVVSVVAKLGLLLAANPVVAGIAAIAAGAALIYQNWSGIVDWFKSRFAEIGEFLNTYLIGPWNDFMGRLSGAESAMPTLTDDRTRAGRGRFRGGAAGGDPAAGSDVAIENRVIVEDRRTVTTTTTRRDRRQQRETTSHPMADAG